MTYQPLGSFGPTCDPATAATVTVGPPGSVGNPSPPQKAQVGIPVAFVVDNPSSYSPLETGDPGSPFYFGPLCDPRFIGRPRDLEFVDPASEFRVWPPVYNPEQEWPDFLPEIPMGGGQRCKWDPINKVFFDCEPIVTDGPYGPPVVVSDPNCVGSSCYKFVDRLKLTYERDFAPPTYTGPEFDEFYCLGYWSDEKYDPSIFELTTQTTNLQIGIANNESYEHLLSSTSLYKTWRAGYYTGQVYNQWARDNFVHTTNYDAIPNNSETFYVLHPVSEAKLGTHTVEYGADNAASFRWSGREGENNVVFDNSGTFDTCPQTATITFTEPGWKRFEFTITNGPGSSAWNLNPAGIGVKIPTLDGFNIATFAEGYPGGTGREGKDVNSKILWQGTGRTGELQLEQSHNTIFGTEGTGTPPRQVGTVRRRFLIENDSLAITVASKEATTNINTSQPGENYDEGDMVLWIENVEVLKSPPSSFHGWGSYLLELNTGNVYDGSLNYAQFEAATPTPGAWVQQALGNGDIVASMLPRDGYLKSYGTVMLNIFDSTITTTAQNYVFQYKTVPETFAVTHPLWSTFANEHMCWVNPAVCTLPAMQQEITYNILFPNSQEYVWEVCGDDDVKFFLDGSQIGPLSVGFATNGDTTFTQYVTSGPRTLLVRCTNTKWNDTTAYQWASNPGGWGFRISTTGNTPTAPIQVTFDSNGDLISSGGTGSASVSLELNWNDNPNTAGTAVDTIQFGGKTWTQTGQTGIETHTVTITGSGTNNVTYNGITGGFTVEDNGTRLCMKDNDGSDCNANFIIRNVQPVVQIGAGIPDEFQLLNMDGEWEDATYLDFVQREDNGSGWTALDQSITGDYAMTGGTGSGLELTMTFQPISGGNDTYDSIVSIDAMKASGSGYAAGDILNVSGLSPGYSSVVKIKKVINNVENAAHEIFNSRMGVGQALFKEGEESTINTGLAATPPLFGTTGFLEVVHAPSGYATTGCATYTDSTSTTGTTDVIVPDTNDCQLFHLGGTTTGCGKFRIRVIIDGTEVINSLRDNWAVPDNSLNQTIDPQSSIQVVVENGTEANAEADVTTKFEIISATTSQRVLLITCRFEPTI